MQTPHFQSQKKATPFGAHFAGKLDEANTKVVCQLSAVGRTSCTDDSLRTGDGPRGGQIP